jgi:hypothetical protein
LIFPGVTAKRICAGVVAALVIVLLSACGSPKLAPTPVPMTAETSPVAAAAGTPTPTGAIEGEPCASGKLLIGDLPEIDNEWRQGVEEATAKATAWQQDAVLSNLRVVCQIFETDFRWQATFYSVSAQAFFSSDTGEVAPSSVEEKDVPLLDVQQFSFERLYGALNGAGYGDEMEISPTSGVDIRLNTVEAPFGPPDAPDNVILYHVAIERLGEIRDLFVDGKTGAIYVYTM